MRRTSVRAILILAAVLAAPGPADAQSKPDAEFERGIAAQLRDQSPEAVAVFEQANAARLKGDYKTAADLYGRVRVLAPSFVHATRRLCDAESNLGHRARAIALCREALAASPSAENLTALAIVLSSRTAAGSASSGELVEARGLIEKAVPMKPKDPFVYFASAQVAVARNDLQSLLASVNRLEVLAPREPTTFVMKAIAAASSGDFGQAREALDTARRLGLSEEGYRSLRDSIQAARPWYIRWGLAAAKVLGFWFAGFAVLFVTGAVLSGIALRAAQRPPESAAGSGDGASTAVLRVYAVVLWLCCIFFYVSIPLVVLTVLAFAGGLLYAIFAIGHIPIKLVLVIVVLAGTTVLAILRSLFVRGRDEDPGQRLDLARHQKLRDVLDAVAARIQTRPVDSVYLTPGTSISVMERGGMLRRMAGQPERCLILGAGVLDGLGLVPFQAILAHEYGHFSNRDTAGGRFALAVRRSVGTMAMHLAEGGAAAWFNPAWLFIHGFHRVLLRVSQGASRLQEALADRLAAFHFGADAFERGLTHVITQQVRLNARVMAAIEETTASRSPIANLYTYHPAKPIDESRLDEAVREAVNRKPSPYDSHPSPADRFRWVRALPAGGAVQSSDDRSDVWSLLGDRDELEKRMTDEFRQNLANFHGIHLPLPRPS